MKFAHLGDCHLGSWRQPELKYLNFQSFQKAVSICIKEKVEFILITGDLFDSAYPPIETLKETFEEFRKIKEARIPVFLIAGSHDYSISGKTFLDVLSKAGFCMNVSRFEERNGQLILLPTVYKNAAIYGYPGKKSSIEVEEIEKAKIQDSPGLYKILMLHTAIRDAAPNPMIKAVDEKKLPEVDYLALSHLHIKYNKDGRAYSGPTFPNSLLELEELRAGYFNIVQDGLIKRQEIKLKEVFTLNLEIKDALSATNSIINFLKKENIKDKIVILRIHGTIEKGKASDIDFTRIESAVRESGAFVFIKSTTKLQSNQPELKFEVIDSDNLENQLIKSFEEKNPSRFNHLIPQLIKSLQVEKLEDEKNSVFEERLTTESKKIINPSLKNET